MVRRSNPAASRSLDSSLKHIHVLCIFVLLCRHIQHLGLLLYFSFLWQPVLNLFMEFLAYMSEASISHYLHLCKYENVTYQKPYPHYQLTLELFLTGWCLCIDKWPVAFHCIEMLSQYEYMFIWLWWRPQAKYYWFNKIWHQTLLISQQGNSLVSQLTEQEVQKIAIPKDLQRLNGKKTQSVHKAFTDKIFSVGQCDQRLAHCGVLGTNSSGNKKSVAMLLTALWVFQSPTLGAAQSLYSLLQRVRGPAHNGWLTSPSHLPPPHSPPGSPGQSWPSWAAC